MSHKTKRDRQDEAALRCAVRAMRTTDEQLMLIAVRPGDSLRERLRLGAQS